MLEDNVLEDEWRPRNYSGRFFGPTRLREALVKSRNLVSIRVLQELGIPRAVSYAERFQFEPRSLPKNLSLALGSGDMTPLQLATAYTVFANGGYTVPPRFIDKIVDNTGQVVYQSAAVQSCENQEQCDELEKQNLGINSIEDVAVINTEQDDESNPIIEPETAAANDAPGIPTAPLVIASPRVIDERNAFIMRSIMREVISRGTARRARELGRSDLAGKTGTTNDLFDAWFTGFNSQLVATAWIGYDEQQSMGPKESGGRAALPMWVDYMRVALDGVPEDNEFQPEGIATVRIDSKTGKLATPGSDDSFFEYFMEENMPTEYAEPQTQFQQVNSAVEPVVAPPQPAPVVTAAPSTIGNQPVSQQQPVQQQQSVQPAPPTPAPVKKSTKKKQVDSLF